MALQMKYFVLKPSGGDAYSEASRCAMMEYSRQIQPTDPELAASLSAWARTEKGRSLVESDSQTPTNYASTQLADVWNAIYRESTVPRGGWATEIVCWFERYYPIIVRQLHASG
jgi:hypothetical protein